MRKIVAITVAVLSLCVAGVASATALPKMPAPGSRGAQLQVRPHYFTITGDGSGFYGGRTGHRVTGGGTSRPNFGRLTWTSYTSTDAYATGISWAKYPVARSKCDAEVCEPFKIVGTISLHAYQPVNGIFRRLRFTEMDGRHRYTGVLDAIHSGFWYWTQPISRANVATARYGRCAVPSRPSHFFVSLGAHGVSCREAQAVAVRSTKGDPVVPFRVAGHTWHLASQRHPHGDTEQTFRSGTSAVRLTFRGEAN